MISLWLYVSSFNVAAILFLTLCMREMSRVAYEAFVLRSAAMSSALPSSTKLSGLQAKCGLELLKGVPYFDISCMHDLLA